MRSGSEVRRSYTLLTISKELNTMTVEEGEEFSETGTAVEVGVAGVSSKLISELLSWEDVVA